MQKIVSSDIVIAYSQCPRKAFLLMSGEQGMDVEYANILKQKRFLQKSEYVKGIKPTRSDIQIDKSNDLRTCGDTLVNVNLKSEYFETGCDILARAYKVSSVKKADYEPTIFIGSHNVSKEHKLELAFVGYILGKIEGQIPEKGTIVSADGKSHGLKLKPLLKSLQKIVSPLQDWLSFPTRMFSACPELVDTENVAKYTKSGAERWQEGTIGSIQRPSSWKHWPC